MKPSLTVTIRKREGVVFEGDAASVSGTNARGPFDILPEHAHFVSIIREHIMIRRAGSAQPVSVSISRGILRVKENRVEVYVGV